MSQISRVVRIFISSTFRDFGGERDELVKRIFPELRRRCKARFIELLEVDLRWGVTEEQNRRGDTLRICLQEIDRCRPSSPVFFIGLLGDRYGWIPEKDYYPKDVLEDPSLRWVQEHVGGKSVTELEILHGVLNNADMAQKAFFYFRKEGYHHRHWQEIQSTYPFLKPEDFSNDTPADTARQKLLKQRISAASLKHKPQEYETPADMAKSVLEDLWKEIDRAFPADKSPDELERQRMEHEAFAQSRLNGYVPRAGLFERMDKLLKSNSTFCTVVSGQSGGGKSALLAAWMKRAKLPSRTFVHYIGGTPESSTVRSIVLRLMETVRRWGAVRELIPDDFGEAVQLLPEWLEKAAKVKKEGILLVLDALNQLEDKRDRNLWWLPKTLPKGVRLVVSTLPGESEEEIKKRGWLKENNRLEVSPLTGVERREIIVSYLGRFTKQLENRLVDRLALELAGQSLPASAADEIRGQQTQVLKDRPEEFLRHLCRAHFVRMRKRVAGGRGSATDAGERPGLQAQGIAHVVKTNAVGELRVDQRHHMTPRTERAGFFSRFSLPRNLGHQKLRNEVANLTQKIQFGPRWNGCFFIHPCRVAGLNKLFQHFFQKSCGMAVNNNMNFLGREKELEGLHNAGAEVKSGKGPGFVGIIVEG